MASVVIIDDDDCDDAVVEYSREDFVADKGDNNNNDGIL